MWLAVELDPLDVKELRSLLNQATRNLHVEVERVGVSVEVNGGAFGLVIVEIVTDRDDARFVVPDQLCHGPAWA